MRTTESVGTTTPPPTETASTPSPTPRTHPDTLFVDAASGSREAPGTRDAPLDSLQEALRRAEPGVEIRVLPGLYQEDYLAGQPLQTVHDGRPGAPITITGARDAVLQPHSHGPAIWIKNSYVHLRGFTVDGLLDPAHPDRRSSYSKGLLIHCRPPAGASEYLEDVVVAPDGIGNSDRALMVFERTKHLEVGPTRVIGVAGAEYVVGDATSHVGEIVYLGQPPSTVDRSDYPWDELDQTRHVRVHHIDNSAGHPHSELVNTKIGTRDVTVEYCTSTGGSSNTESYPSAEVRFQSTDATLRWCDLRNGQGDGVRIIHHRDWLRQRDDPAVSPEESGADHSIYGNVISGFGGKAIRIDTSPEAQRWLCGNQVSREADGSPEQACPEEVPTGEGIGHTGGDSPWA